MGFDNLVTVFGCSIVTNVKNSGFSTVSSSLVIIFGRVINFIKLQSVLQCLTVTNFMLTLFELFTVFDAL